jgi:hypothetical protein
MKMANAKKSIIEEALLEAQQIDAAFKSNAKEILTRTMSSEIEEMVKESLTGSKKRLKEDENENEELDLNLTDDDTEEGEELEGGEEEEDVDLDLDLDTEEGDGEEEDINFDLNIGDDTEEDDFNLDLGDESEEGEDMNLGGMDLDLGDDTEEDEEEGYETVDLTQHNDADVISVFKKMGPEDEIEVVNDNGMVTLKDNKSGSEYRIELNPTGGVSNVEMGDMDMELGEGMDESDEVIYEILVEDEEEEECEGDDCKEVEEEYMSDKEDKMSNSKSNNTDFMSRNMKYRQIEKGQGNRAGIRKESTAPQITKLIKENTDLTTKLSTTEVENSELKENHTKMVDALKQFRKKLQEVAVFNSNLTYAVRLFTEQSTTKGEKQEILKRLDSAKDLKESQSIYKQLVKEYTNGKATIKESIEEKINKTASSGAQISESSVFVHPELQNMKKLWEYSYKK